MLSLLLTALLPAFAQDCDPKALDKALAEAPPARMAPAFVKLAECDADRAKKAAGTQFKRMLSDKDSVPAAVAAIRVGAGSDVRAWLSTQEPDGRSRMLTGIGNACTANNGVGGFFGKALSENPKSFWEERWYRGLAECRTADVRALLENALKNDVVGRDARNRTAFVSVLEVYARNLGEAAIPTLVSYLSDPRDEEEATLVLNAFGNAAGLGSRDGINTNARDLVVKRILDNAAGLPPRALSRAREILNSLDATAEAESLYQYVHPDRMQDGAYVYGLVIVEDVACKNDQRRGVLHLGSFTEPGALWVDTLKASITQRAEKVWTLDAASKCKGEAQLNVYMSDAPLPVGQLQSWHDARTKSFEEEFAGAQKTWVVVENGWGW